MSAEKKICPYCGKPAGELTLCTNCGAELYKRTTFRLPLLTVGVILAMGVATTYQAAFGGISLMRVGELTDIHNYAYGWFEGTVSYGPLYIPHPSIRLDFKITDDWGDTIEVRAYSDHAKVLARENRIPRVGDRVRFFGRVRIEPGMRRLEVDNAQTKFELRRTEPKEVTIRRVLENLNAHLNKSVSVEGVVVGLRELVAAHLYTLEDENNRITVYVHKGLRWLTGYRPHVTVGSKLRITGGIADTPYGLQLIPGSLEDIRVVDG